MSNLACIGSRSLSPEQIDVCEKLGTWIVQSGHHLQSGNAVGADQSFARGGNSVDPSSVHLHLPWSQYEKRAVVEGNQVRSVDDLDSSTLRFHTEYAAKSHPVWDRLSDPVRKLMIRNVMILKHCDCHSVDLVLAWPSSKKGGGGTGHSMRVGKALGIEVIDLSRLTRPDLSDLCDRLANLPQEKT